MTEKESVAEQLCLTEVATATSWGLFSLPGDLSGQSGP
jgi:hypothetical protein